MTKNIHLSHIKLVQWMFYTNWTSERSYKLQWNRCDAITSTERGCAKCKAKKKVKVVAEKKVENEKGEMKAKQEEKTQMIDGEDTD